MENKKSYNKRFAKTATKKKKINKPSKKAAFGGIRL